jgi:hypothetical protein
MQTQLKSISNLKADIVNFYKILYGLPSSAVEIIYSSTSCIGQSLVVINAAISFFTPLPLVFGYYFFLPLFMYIVARATV